MPHAHASGFPSPCVLLADRIPSVGQDRLKFWHICQTILNRSGAGAPELQRWARCLPVGETSRSRCSRSAGACPPRCPSSSYVFRSFRTYMSIAARVVPFSRAFRSLIKPRAALAKSIKDLKDLRIFRGRACYRHSGPTDLKDVFSVARTMARDRFSHRPTMQGRRPPQP